MSAIEIPEGYRENAQGHLVPENLIGDLDVLRDDLVLRLIDQAQDLSAEVHRVKAEAMAEVESFVQTAAQEYDTKVGGKLGNITLLSFDGRFKVQRKINKDIVFDERLQIAKQLVDECIHEWTEGSRDELKALVEHAFQTDKEGSLNTARIYSLFQLKITDAKWRKAMDAIRDSMQVSGTKAYLNFYQRVGEGDSADWQHISVDMAAA